jgi:hypothetical protein
MITAYVTVGNSDDKLTQVEWCHFHPAVDQVVRRAAQRVHGAWVSPSADPWQNACWCIEVDDSPGAFGVQWLRGRLTNLAVAYQQDSIAWAEAPQVEFLGAPS